MFGKRGWLSSMISKAGTAGKVAGLYFSIASIMASGSGAGIVTKLPPQKKLNPIVAIKPKIWFMGIMDIALISLGFIVV